MNAMTLMPYTNSNAPGWVMAFGEWVHWVVVRDEDGVVFCYINGSDVRMN